MSEPLRPLPKRVWVNDAYPDAQHCSSCHEDVEYGFEEAVEDRVYQLPDGSLAVTGDSCCALLQWFDAVDVHHMDGWDYQYDTTLPQWAAS